MTTSSRRAVLLVVVCSLPGLAGCAAATTSGSTPQRRAAARSAVSALQAGSFDEAARLSGEVLAKDPVNSQALLVAAITRYKSSMHQLSADLRTMVPSLFSRGRFNDRFVRWSLLQGEAELAKVEDSLASAAKDRTVDLELCLACWKIDWNQNGRLDSSDERLLQIEMDRAGKSLPENDPRRKPTYRFDLGDVYWARAMVSFQRAFFEVLLAYDFSQATATLTSGSRDAARVQLGMREPQRVMRARELVLRGLEHSDRARQEYLAETDDDREWVPNPRQKNHPMPLPVDDKLYQTWRDVVGDVRRMLQGKEGIDVAQVVQAVRLRDASALRGFINIGQLFSQPKDITLDFQSWKRSDYDGILRGLFSDAYVATMPATPLIGRLQRMAGEVSRGEESFERKLRYLLWLN